MKVSISLGGSLLSRDGDAGVYSSYASVLRELKDRGHHIIVVCGGGRFARSYIETARHLGAPHHLQDRLGILATHMNALLLIAALGGDADPRIHRRASEVRRHLNDRILVGGGHLPGNSTDYRAVLFAEAVGADLIVNATDYGGVFDKDPSEYSDAKQFRSLTFKHLEEIIRERFHQAPGEYGLFDLKATRLAAKCRIPVVFIDGTDPEEIIRALNGSHSGTEIREN